MQKLPRLDDRTSKVQKAYTVIKNSIINMDIKPGEALPEEKLVEQLGISRTPIRAALNKLAYEELVVIYPGKGTYVAEVSYKSMVNTLQIREVLENLSVKLAAQSTNPQQYLKELAETIDCQKRSVEKKHGVLEFLEYDNKFHAIICEMADNIILKKEIENLKNKFNRFVILSKSLNTRAGKVIEEHRMILEALKTKDPVSSVAAMTMHIRNVKLGIEDGIKNIFNDNKLD